MDERQQGEMSQASQDRVLAKMLAIKEGMEQGLVEVKELPKRAPPPSPLEGGEGPSEEVLAGMTQLQKRAYEFGVDLDKVLAMPAECGGLE